LLAVEALAARSSNSEYMVAFGGAFFRSARMNDSSSCHVRNADVAYFDETVTLVAGRNHWLHAAATAGLTAYHIDEHGRSIASMTAFGNPWMPPTAA
jgi:hypothetical protein